MKKPTKMKLFRKKLFSKNRSHNSNKGERAVTPPPRRSDDDPLNADVSPGGSSCTHSIDSQCSDADDGKRHKQTRSGANKKQRNVWLTNLVTVEDKLTSAVVASRTGQQHSPLPIKRSDSVVESKTHGERGNNLLCESSRRYEPLYKHDGLVPSEMLLEVAALVEVVEVYNRVEQQRKQQIIQLENTFESKRAEQIAKIYNSFEHTSFASFQQVHMHGTFLLQRY